MYQSSVYYHINWNRHQILNCELHARKRKSLIRFHREEKLSWNVIHSHRICPNGAALACCTMPNFNCILNVINKSSKLLNLFDAIIWLTDVFFSLSLVFESLLPHRVLRECPLASPPIYDASTTEIPMAFPIWLITILSVRTVQLVPKLNYGFVNQKNKTEIKWNKSQCVREKRKWVFETLIHV